MKGFGLFGGLLLASAAILASEADIDAFFAHEDTRVRAQTSSGIDQPTRRLVQGEPAPEGGCRFDYSSEMREGEGRRLQVEMARNMTTCQSLIEYGAARE